MGSRECGRLLTSARGPYATISAMPDGLQEAALPDRVLRASRWHTVRWLLVALAFLAVSLDDTDWLAVGLFGLASLSLAFQVVFPWRLEIDANGFTDVAFWWRRRNRWSDCSEFRPWRSSRLLLGRSAAVVFENRFSSEGRLSRWLAKAIWGGESVLGVGGHLGLRAKDLAELMNRYREEATDSSTRSGRT